MATVDVPRERTPSPPRQSPPLIALLRGAWDDPATRPSAIGGLVSLGLLGLMFWRNLRHFVLIWSTDENYSHGFLVPLISLYFANEAARRGPVAVRSGVALGSAMLGLAMLAKVSTVVIPSPIVGDYGLILALAGACCVLAGAGVLRRYWFSFFFLVFLVPLPVALYSMIANPLQLAVSKLATSMLNVLDIPALCEGALITLAGDSQLFVAEACSGMRQLTGFLALTTAWAHLSDRPAWARLLLVASSIPIAMTANVVRVTITGVITYHLDAKYASGAFHTIEGLAMMGLGLLMIATFSWAIDQLASFLDSSGRVGSPPLAGADA
jgi:exosortase